MIRSFIALLFLIASALYAEEFRHLGDFMLQSHVKVTAGKVTPVPMKPVAFQVYTDGLTIRVGSADDAEAQTTFQIYRSDGVGRRRNGGGGIEVIPGLQATSTIDGVLRHLRLSSEALTITTFPGISDQTIITHAVAIARREEKPQPSPSPVKP